MCLGASKNFSIYTAPLPNAASASLRALLYSFLKVTELCAVRMPLPPPPATALIMTGKPIFSATFRAVISSSTVPSLPGITGTFALTAISRALALSPKLMMALELGPTNFI